MAHCQIFTVPLLLSRTFELYSKGMMGRLDALIIGPNLHYKFDSGAAFASGSLKEALLANIRELIRVGDISQ